MVAKETHGLFYGVNVSRLDYSYIMAGFFPDLARNIKA